MQVLVTAEIAHLPRLDRKNDSDCGGPPHGPPLNRLEAGIDTIAILLLKFLLRLLYFYGMLD